MHTIKTLLTTTILYVLVYAVLTSTGLSLVLINFLPYLLSGITVMKLTGETTKIAQLGYLILGQLLILTLNALVGPDGAYTDSATCGYAQLHDKFFANEVTPSCIGRLFLLYLRIDWSKIAVASVFSYSIYLPAISMVGTNRSINR